MKKYALVTGSGGLIGSEAVKHLCVDGYKVIGIDNNMRAYFFGKEAGTDWNTKRLLKLFPEQFKPLDVDIRNYEKLSDIFIDVKFELVIHTAAQPSHDWAANDPKTDFSVNAVGTLNLLELVKINCPDASFIFTSTNKVYGDIPNTLPLNELKTRYDLPLSHIFWNGIDENMSIDHSTHSLFGVSKTAADLLTQEYSRYFGLKTAVFRGGCLTGPMHSASALHGFLAYLVKCIVNETPYTVYGYKGKQVRDNIHSQDLIQMFMEFHRNPKDQAVYNAGGGRDNSISILEAVDLISTISKKTPIINIVEENRHGDHQWYITNNSKFIKDYPEWKITYKLEKLIEEMVYAAQHNRQLPTK
jgi:CDP-paratose 2-epimerase